jgi:hypothetical protein
MSEGLQREARTYRPVILLAASEDYAAALADAGFAHFTSLVLAACDAARERMGTPRDHRFERITADARATAERLLSPTEWEDAYARGLTMSVLDALAEALSSTASLQL